MSDQKKAPKPSTDNLPRQEAQQSNDVSVNMVELREIVELVSTHGFTDFELEREGFRVRLRREQMISGGASGVQPAAPQHISQMPVAQSAPATTPAQSAATSASAVRTAAGTGPSEEASDTDLHTIISPIVGTFYRAPSPSADVFVNVGSTIGTDTVVCIVEAMKLMNEILAETTGTIEKIYVENGQPVEYGQPLFGVRK